MNIFVKDFKIAVLTISSHTKKVIFICQYILGKFRVIVKYLNF